MNIHDSESFNKPKHNLITQTTDFVGREQELYDLATLLSNPTVRLITLLSPGGMGKTRLALALAEQQLSNYLHGIYFIPLAPLESKDSIVPTIASAMNFTSRLGTDPLAQLLDYLQNREILLILDNYEHLLDGAELVSEMLKASPSLQVVVTSRERLQLTCEVIYLIGGMTLPDGEITKEVFKYSSVQLFVQTARRLRPNWNIVSQDLKHIVHIGNLTQGMPLAIILAASWFNLLSLSEIAKEIEHNLDFLKAELQDLPERQHSIRAIFEGTWKRLSETERNVFGRLSVLRGGCFHEAAIVVTEANLITLQGLVDKALIVRSDTGRYEVHEVLRQYGEKWLAKNPKEYYRVRDKHCDYFADFTLKMYEGHHTSETRLWLELIGTELDNIQYGWDWAIQHAKREALWQFSKLYLFYSLRCRYEEGEAILARSVAAIEASSTEHQSDILLARLLAFHVYLCHFMIKIDKLDTSHQKSLAILAQVDNVGIDRETVAILYFLGSSIAFFRPAEARELLERCLQYCRLYNHRDPLMVAALMNLFSFTPILSLDVSEIEDGLSLAQQLDYVRGIGMFTQYRGMIAYWKEGNMDAAKNWLGESIDLHRISDDPLNLAGAFVTLGEIYLDTEKYQESKQSLLDALGIFDMWGCLPWILSPTLVCVARLLVKGGNWIGSAKVLACINHARFLNHHPFYPINIVKNTDTRSLSIILDSKLSPAELTQAREYSRSLNMVSAIQNAQHILEDTDFLDDVHSTMSDFEIINKKLHNPITPREFEVLQYIIAGYSNDDITKEIVISKNTLKSHINHLYHKLEVKNRAQAILRSQELGLLK